MAGIICRVRTPLTGGAGGAGVITTYFHNNVFETPTGSQLHSYLSSWHQFWDSVKGVMSNDVTVNFPGSQEGIDENTGALVSQVHDTSPPSAVAGTSAGTYAAGVGCRVYWRTSNIRNRRLVKGWFYLTPIVAGSLSIDGSIDSTALTTINNALTVLLAAWASGSVVPCVWHRNSSLGSSDGNANDVNSADAHSIVSSLRTRRT